MMVALGQVYHRREGEPVTVSLRELPQGSYTAITLGDRWALVQSGDPICTHMRAITRVTTANAGAREPKPLPARAVARVQAWLDAAEGA